MAKRVLGRIEVHDGLGISADAGDGVKADDVAGVVAPEIEDVGVVGGPADGLGAARGRG